VSSIFNPITPSFLNATSSEKTTPNNGNSNWLQMTGNSITLTAGTWFIFVQCLFGRTATTTSFQNYGVAICTANGADDTSQPTVLTANKGGITDTTNANSSNYGSWQIQNADPRTLSSTLCCCHAVSSNTIIYAVPKYNALNNAGRCIVNIFAYKLSDSTS
jgi:hypothetical protein